MRKLLPVIILIFQKPICRKIIASKCRLPTKNSAVRVQKSSSYRLLLKNQEHKKNVSGQKKSLFKLSLFKRARKFQNTQNLKRFCDFSREIQEGKFLKTSLNCNGIAFLFSTKLYRKGIKSRWLRVTKELATNIED